MHTVWEIEAVRTLALRIIAVLLAVLGTWAHAHAESYAALWERNSGAGWVARHGLTADGYQREFDALIARGYRLHLKSGY
jgi:hypothetical protein